MNNVNLPWKVRSAASKFRKQRARYYEYMASMLAASKGGTKLLQMFERDAERYKDSPRGVLATYWMEKFSTNGADLADAWEGTLPGDEVAIVRIAQDAGDGALLTALNDIARIAMLSDKISKTVWGTLAAGVLGLSIATTMLFLYPIFSAGKVQELFGFIPYESWGPTAKSFVSHSERVKTYGIYILLLLGMLAGYVVWSLDNLVGVWRDRLDRRFMLYRILRDLKGALFLSTMATLSRKRGNVMFTLRDSLESFANSSRSQWLRWRVQEIVDGVDRTGGVGSDAFNTNLLSPEMFHYLQDTQEARGFAEGFEETGKYVENTIIDGVLRTLMFYRWMLLLLGVVSVVGVMFWQFAVINEMKNTMQIYYTSK